MAKTAWTPEQEQLVREMYGKVRCKVICEQLGKTKSQLQYKLAMLGISNLKPEKEALRVSITQHKGYRVIEHRAV